MKRSVKKPSPLVTGRDNPPVLERHPGTAPRATELLAAGRWAGPGLISLRGLLVLAVLVAATGSIVPLRAWAAEGETVTIRILWTNDTHGYLRPVFHREEGEAGYLEKARKEGRIGGFAHIATVVNQLRGEMPAHTLFLDAGDTLHGTAVPLFDEGKPVIEVMNAMGYDAMVPGNTDFLYPKEVLLERREEANFPIIAANIYDLEWGDPVLDSHIVKEIQGIKVAIIGMTYQWNAKTGDRKLTEGWSFGLREREVRELIETLREEGEADVVILLSHMGYRVDQKYASRVKGIDAIVGAHTHDITRDPPVVGETIVVQAGSHGKYVGRLDLKFRDGKRVGFDNEIIRVVAKDVPADPKIAAIIEKAYAPYKEKLERVIGVTETMLYRRARWQSTMDNFITDAYRDIMKADVAFGPAWRFGATILPGDIRVEDVYNMVPTTGTILTYTMSGQVIRNVLESAIDNVLNEDPYLQLGGDMVRFAGMEVRYKESNSIGKRIEAIKVGGRPLDLQKKYAIVSANTQFQNAPGVEGVHDSRRIAVEELIRYIERQQTIAPRLDGRIQPAQ